MEELFFRLVGIIPISSEGPSFGTPIFTNDQRQLFLQVSRKELVIDDFLELPSTIQNRADFIHLRANLSYCIGDPFLVGFIDTNKRVGAYRKGDLKEKLFSEFNEYVSYPFVALAVANFLKDDKFLRLAIAAPEVAEAIKLGEINRPRLSKPTSVATKKPKLTWSDDRVAQLQKLWSAGLSASQIAAEMGNVTRNAIIGKIHKLGLPTRSSAVDYERVVPMSQRLSLLKLNEVVCHWPVGDPSSPDFFFCGRQALQGLPYCAEHSRFAYTPASERRKSKPK